MCYRRGLPSVTLVLTLVCALAFPYSASAQFGRLKGTLLKAGACGVSLPIGYDLGKKVAEWETKKLGLVGEEAAKHRRAIQIGMAVALCATSAYLVGTVYNNLSERDREARKREMDAALADAKPGSRSYVLPDSGLAGTISTEQVEVEGDRECVMTVDVPSTGNESARARFCRNGANGNYQLDGL